MSQRKPSKRDIHKGMMAVWENREMLRKVYHSQKWTMDWDEILMFIIESCSSRLVRNARKTKRTVSDYVLMIAQPLVRRASIEYLRRDTKFRSANGVKKILLHDRHWMIPAHTEDPTDAMELQDIKHLFYKKAEEMFGGKIAEQLLIFALAEHGEKENTAKSFGVCYETLYNKTRLVISALQSDEQNR